jgi:endonuclease YncB( thermonuclease family)
MKKIVFLVGILLCTSTFAIAFTGAVVRVSDGDTIVVDRAGEQVRVRLYGIDTPEKKQVFGTQATRYVSKRVLHKTVRVEEMDVDRYGRTVAIVYDEDPRSLNERLVRDGLAWVYTRYCRSPECDGWASLQQAASAGGVGLWQDPGAIPPWEWRKARR